MSLIRLNASALREVARARGDLRPVDISRATGIPQSTLSALLSGQRAPAASTLYALSDRYELTHEQLLTMEAEAA
ncbi:helix-turn-helix domain-containing protein [Streptomyces sp. NPDC001262]|uniref:helix-turn-helix domain-containing protein n=1 Tax=Streptomyces sp. NPDC001262 TaxID=3364552 RepID=UPI0036AB17C2